MFDLKFILDWSKKYPVNYDDAHYYPYLVNARNGDIESLRKITEWKNVGGDENSPYPMAFNRQKKEAFDYFSHNLNSFLTDNGSQNLKEAFKNRTPVWSLFWHHVLFDTPIFDVYTNIAFQYDTTGILLSKEQAKIKKPSHWSLYDQYCIWFDNLLEKLKNEDSNITSRQIDRALVCWAINTTKQIYNPSGCF